MPRKAKELSAKHVRDLNKTGLHAVGGVAGLQLQITSPSAKSWILRTMIGNKRHDIGLGGFPDVGLAQARENAREIKQQITQGINPLEHRKELKQALLKKQRQTVSFKEIAFQCHAVKSQEFKNPKHASQWIKTLETYAFPIIGNMNIETIDVSDVLNVLEPIWAEKTETATRLRQRISSVFDHAIASGLRKTTNPADWKGCLQPLLPNPSSMKRKHGKDDNHLPALTVNKIPEFVRTLRTLDS